MEPHDPKRGLMAHGQHSKYERVMLSTLSVASVEA